MKAQVSINKLSPHDGAISSLFLPLPSHAFYVCTIQPHPTPHLHRTPTAGTCASAWRNETVSFCEEMFELSEVGTDVPVHVLVTSKVGDIYIYLSMQKQNGCTLCAISCGSTFHLFFVQCHDHSELIQKLPFCFSWNFDIHSFALINFFVYFLPSGSTSTGFAPTSTSRVSFACRSAHFTHCLCLVMRRWRCASSLTRPGLPPPSRRRSKMCSRKHDGVTWWRREMSRFWHPLKMYEFISTDQFDSKFPVSNDWS